MVRFTRVASSVFMAAFVISVLLAVASACAAAMADNCGVIYCDNANACMECCNILEGDCWKSSICDCTCTEVFPWTGCQGGWVCQCEMNP